MYMLKIRIYDICKFIVLSFRAYNQTSLCGIEEGYVTF